MSSFLRLCISSSIHLRYFKHDEHEISSDADLTFYFVKIHDMDTFFASIIKKIVDTPRSTYLKAFITSTIVVAAGYYLFKIRFSSNSKKNPRHISLLKSPTVSMRSILLNLIKETSKHASTTNAIIPLTTESSVLMPQLGIPFIVTPVSPAAHALKPRGSNFSSANSNNTAKKEVDIFAPPLSSDTFVSHVGISEEASSLLLDSSPDSHSSTYSPSISSFDASNNKHSLTHSIILNKYPVVPEHLVIVTREFLSQLSPMDVDDLGILYTIVQQVHGVGFYNCGLASGASQPRRHMQFFSFENLFSVVNKDGSKSLSKLPFDAAVETYRSQSNYKDSVGSPFEIPGIPYPHRVCMLGNDVKMATPFKKGLLLHEYYTKSLKQIQTSNGDSSSSSTSISSMADIGAAAIPPTPHPHESISHNVILTPEYLLVVPRQIPEWEGVSVNSLGYAGLFLVKGTALESLQKLKPLSVLRQCSVGTN
jgi:sulfate adenylyltransferase (ADP) / ATP adenylyltransferase